MTRLKQISESLFVYSGSINTGIIRSGNACLIIDFGDGSAMEALPEIGVTEIKEVLFTHHHRDQASGLIGIDDFQAEIGVPERERVLFGDVKKFWNDQSRRWHIYNFHPHNLMLHEPIIPSKTYKEGNVIQWDHVKISVLDTPGHTDGSISYVVEADGKRFVFSGDVIYDHGKVWELYSLQKGNQFVTDYHGFMGSREELKQSLQKICKSDPDLIIPSHGNIIDEPLSAISALIERMDRCYDRYVAISALRHYFPEMFAEFHGRPGHMRVRPGKQAPEFLKHYGTTWLILSENSDAFVIDCGSADVVRYILGLQTQGIIRNIGGLWITHYHDDHVDGIPAFIDAFDCPIYADDTIANILKDPLGFRLPCISPVSISNIKRTTDKESWAWNEFKMTAYHFPGQTYYHGGLLVEGRGARIFFAGDSFTMSGIDDYCVGNRNWLGDNVGFDRCLRLINELNPTDIINCHVDLSFDFTPEEIQFMRDNLKEREELFGELLPWDSPNYGLDEHWIGIYPYEQDVVPGNPVKLEVRVTNHSSTERIAKSFPILPMKWKVNVSPVSAVIPAHSEGSIMLNFVIPVDISEERVIVPFDITYNDISLGQFRECIINVKRPGH